MLFAQRGDSDAAFTMAGMTHPLDIAWYAADGSGSTRRGCAPCPTTDARPTAPCTAATTRTASRSRRPAGAFGAGPICAVRLSAAAW